jgi:FkbM family methyltransferase
MQGSSGMFERLGALKYHLIRTPFEEPVCALRSLARLPQRLRHPELSEIHREDARIKQVLQRCLRPDSNLLDVGAHYGSMLSPMTRLAPHGRHTAVEAIPAKAAFLRRKFPEVSIHNLALSEHPGSVDFFINKKRTGFSGLARHGESGDEFEKIEVPCETLDRLMQDAPRVHFMKIDVEGAEEMVLRSGKGFLAEHGPTILFECGPSGARAFGREPTDLFDLLEGTLGYDVFLLRDWLADGAGVSREEFAEALVYPFKAFNWVAQPRS